MLNPEEQAEFRIELRDMWAKDGIACPNGLRHTFREDDRARPEVSDLCLRYVEHWDQALEHGLGMLFYGSVGTGKSFYASAIAAALQDRSVKVAVTNLPRMLNVLQGARARNEVLDRLSCYKLLVLDDLGVERESAWAAEQCYAVLDARYQSGLPLIVTTNLTMEDLERPESMQHRRIYDRVLEMCGDIPVKLTGQSRRTARRKEKQTLARALLLGQAP